MPMLAVMRKSCSPMRCGASSAGDDLVGADGGIVRMDHIGEQNQEFVAALPADRVGAAHAGEQALRATELQQLDRRSRGPGSR